MLANQSFRLVTLLHLGVIELRARNGVGGVLLIVVDVVQDAGVVALVELSGDGALRGLGAAAADLQVDALGVELGAALLEALVEGDDLVAEDVVSGLDVGGDLDAHAEVVLEELVVRPEAGASPAGAELDLALLLDLEPLEGVLVGVGAVAAAVGEVVDDGAVVALGPCVPLQLNIGASSDGGALLGTGGAEVAADIIALELVGRDEAQVGGPVGPGDTALVLLPGSVAGVVANMRLAISNNLLDVAVGADRCSAGEGGDEGLGSHAEVM